MFKRRDKVKVIGDGSFLLGLVGEVVDVETIVSSKGEYQRIFVRFEDYSDTYDFFAKSLELVKE